MIASDAWSRAEELKKQKQKARLRAEKRRQMESLNGVQKPEWGIKKMDKNNKKGETANIQEILD